MAKITQAAALITALLARGEKEMQTRATRYRAFTRTFRYQRAPDGELMRRNGADAAMYFYVSTGGALRTGRVNDGFHSSITADTKGKAMLLAEGGYGVKQKQSS